MYAPARTTAQRWALLAALALAVAGCEKKPPPEKAGSGSSSDQDGWTAGDGASWWGPDGTAGEDGVTLTDGGTAGGNDGGTTPPKDGGTTPPKDGGPVDTGEDVFVPPDETPPTVVSAFSSDGERITVRYDEDMDPVTGADAENFTVRGSDNSQLGVTLAETDGLFATLTLDAAAKINPSLTYTVQVKNVTDLAGNKIHPQKNKATIRRSVYLTIIWHQHQPLYHDAIRDEMSGPWVRKHATKDYYDMAAILELYPDVNLNINITVVLLNQLNIYLERLGPYVDVKTNTVDAPAFLAKWKGHTDPWVDLLLEPTPTPKSATEAQLDLLYAGPWSCVSTSDQIMQRFPEYVALREKNPAELTQEDFLALKIWFELAWFDPDFLDGPVTMPDGSVVDLSDVLEKKGGKYTLRVPLTEAVANRLVADNYKIMANTVAIHKKLMYDPDTKKGQIELATTPFYHPILPLIFNSDLAKQGQPFDPVPSPPYAYPEDANAQVARAVAFFEETFGIKPRGMWPGEGSVAEDVVHLFVDNGIRWIATASKVLEKSTPSGQPAYYPYRVDGDKAVGDNGNTDDEMIILFRDTELSDKVGFTFQSLTGAAATQEFFKDVLAQAPSFGGKDRMVVVILDGENAWESYKYEHDGKGFFHALYGALQQSYQVGEIIPVTVSEYLDGNPARNVPPHPVHEQTELEPLWAGSWIDGTFAIWIGEGEENLAWGCLAKSRAALAQSGLPQPNPSAPPPVDTSSYAWLVWKAWDEIYAAEGSDWFWWFGQDMTTPSNDDTPFDKGFRAHLAGMSEFMNEALAMKGKPPIDVPECPPIIQAKPKALEGPFTKPPVIDGKFTPNESEWDIGGALYFDDDSGGAIKNPDDDIAVVYYGYDATTFYVGISANEVLSDKLGKSYDLAVYLSHKHVVDAATGTFQQDPFNTTTPQGLKLEFKAGGAAREVRVDFSGATAKVGLNKANGSGGWTPAANSIKLGGPLAGNKIIELGIPFTDMGFTLGDPLELLVVAVEGGKVIDAAPTLGSKIVFEDVTNQVYVTFEVDVSGTCEAIDKYTSLKNPPPPPDGNKGIVYITGNQDSLSNWVPNKIPMVDNGVAPDLKAKDYKWTATFPFAPGTLLRYKYTVGLPSQEGSWSQSEEFPLTERGYEVPQDPGIKKVTLKDCFADRPQPSGTLGPKTKVETSGK
ncbi:MAG: hypothetical protein AMXMBFR64_51270 [Myxococcales bacterium]